VQVWWRSGHLPARSDGQCKFTQIQYDCVHFGQTDYNTSLPRAGEVIRQTVVDTSSAEFIKSFVRTIATRWRRHQAQLPAVNHLMDALSTYWLLQGACCGDISRLKCFPQRTTPFPRAMHAYSGRVHHKP